MNIQEHETHFDLQSQEYLLKPIFSEAALTVAVRNQIPTFSTLTYLANTISANGKTVPYSTIVALPTDQGTFAEYLDRHVTETDMWAYGQAYDQEIKRREPEISEENKKLDEKIDRITKEVNTLAETGSKLSKTEYKQRLDEADIASTEVQNALKAHRARRKPGEIVLNTWTAADLGVKVGDGINITYYRVGASEEYIIETASFPLTGFQRDKRFRCRTVFIPIRLVLVANKGVINWKRRFPFGHIGSIMDTGKGGDDTSIRSDAFNR